VLHHLGYAMPRATLRPLVVASLAVAVYAAFASPVLRRLILVALLLIVFLDLRSAGQFIVAHGLYGGFYKVNLDSYYDPGGAGAFLLAQQETQAPFRFFGYDPAVGSVDTNNQDVLYRYQFTDPEAEAILVNNRATYFGVQDIQGYNPIQLDRYVDFITALNGDTQEYHGSYVFPGGLDSPLLNLLNVRYIVIPAVFTPDRGDLESMIARFPTVYQDASVRVLENTQALPRAWLVHNARQVSASDSVNLLANGTVDPRQTALVETAPPPLAQPADTDADRATVTTDAPNQIRVTTHSGAASLLMLSEIYYPAWKAYVDGKPVKLYEADHVLRAVPVPAGTHTVELRYQSSTLNLGLAITLVALAAFLALLTAAGWRFLRLSVLRRGHDGPADARGAHA